MLIVGEALFLLEIMLLKYKWLGPDVIILLEDLAEDVQGLLGLADTSFPC